MNKKIMAAAIAMKALGCNSMQATLPYWTELLDGEYSEASSDYQQIVQFLKGIGCKVYRNSQGKHLLVYDEGMKEV